MKRILLTGSTGFLGTRLLAVLREKNYDIIVSKEDITKLFPTYNVDCIIHAAALVNLSRDFQIGKYCFEVNTLGTMRVLESFRHKKPKLFIYISSEEVYGNGPIPFLEDQTPEPPSPYAISKLAGEHLALWYGKEYDIPVAIVRLGTFYGPGQPKHKYFTQVILHAVKNEPIPCNSGQKKRDYIYIDDAVDLILKLLETKKTVVVNGAGGKPYRLLDVIDIVKALTQSKSEVKIGEIPDRITERDEWLSDITRAKKLFGWEPKVDLEEGLRRMVVWFQKNN
jgi:nucleoside-diphosphate-sugar epimerase